MKQPRRPGDQAPPPRPVHRNDNLRTATTHIKDTEGKLWCVHDGSPEMNILRYPDGQREMSMLSWADARKAKDIAVTQLKQRKATIAELDLEATGAPLEVNTADSFVPPTQSLPDPHLEAQRQKAVAAARPVAAQAQARAAQVQQRAPGWEPAPKAAPATGKAPGWEPPPQGVSSAKKASPDNKEQGKAAGWAAPSAGEKSAPPSATASVGLDDLTVGDGDDGDGDGTDLSDLMVNPDLESDVKAETERAVTAAKAAWDGLSTEEQAQVRAQVIRVATEGEREKMYSAMDPEQIGTFEAFEQAYHLLFGLPPVKPAQATEAKAP